MLVIVRSPQTCSGTTITTSTICHLCGVMVARPSAACSYPSAVLLPLNPHLHVPTCLHPPRPSHMLPFPRFACLCRDVLPHYDAAVMANAEDTEPRGSHHRCCIRIAAPFRGRCHRYHHAHRRPFALRRRRLSTPSFLLRSAAVSVLAVLSTEASTNIPTMVMAAPLPTEASTNIPTMVMAAPLPTTLPVTDTTSIEYDGLGYTGTIPTELGLLTKLTFLSLSVNSLSGTIPTQLMNLDKIVSLGIRGSSLTGSIPTEIAKLRKLANVACLDSNSLKGRVPSQVRLHTMLLVLAS